MTRKLIIDSRDIARLAEALLAGQKIGGIKLINSILSKRVTLFGEGWTLLYHLNHSNSPVGFRIIGDQDRFLEDYVLAKMSIKSGDR